MTQPKPPPPLPTPSVFLQSLLARDIYCIRRDREMLCIVTTHILRMRLCYLTPRDGIHKKIVLEK